MNITLRKASALQNAIQEHIKSIDVKGNINLNQFQGDAVLAEARQTAVQNDQRRAALTNLLYGIRAMVGQANATSGIAERLARAAYIDKRVGQIQGLIATENLQEDSVVINGKLEQLRNDKGESRRSIYGYNDHVSTGVFTAEDIKAYKAKQQELKKQKQTLNDEILELNVRTEITLGDEAVELLKSEGLV